MKIKTTCGLLVLTYLIVAVVGNPLYFIPDAVSVGDNVDIICDGRGLPEYLLNGLTAIFMNGDRPPPRDRYIVVSDSVPGLLRITYLNVNLDDRWNIFSCYFDGLGTMSGGNINVLYPPIISSYYCGGHDLSTNVIASANCNGFEGDGVTFTFDVEANPRVLANDINITGHGIADIDNNSFGYFFQVTVTFSNLMRSDAGNYLVTVTNTEGSGNATFSLDVFFGPNFLQQPSDTVINTTVGVTLILNCSVESNPLANVTFTTTATTTSNVAINPTTGIVTITNTVLGNTGDYTCIADNDVNFNNQTFSVRIGNVPNLRLTYGMISYNMTHIMIPYTITTPNTFGSIHQYNVSCTNYPAAGHTTFPFDPPLPNPVAIPISVICGTTYTISIHASNEFGSAVVASGSFITTDDDGVTPTPSTSTISIHASNEFGSDVVASGSFITTDDDGVTPAPSTNPTGDSIGLVGTTTAVLVVLLGIIATVFIN